MDDRNADPTDLKSREVTLPASGGIFLETIDNKSPVFGLSRIDSESTTAEDDGELIKVKSFYSVATVLRAESQIGLIGCITVIMGCVLGSGIFAAPQEILKLTDSAALTLIVWFSYGIIALVAALCYVELGCTIPVSGGDYAYLNECFGPFPAFLYQWSTNFVVIPASSAIMASVVSKNLVNPYVHDPKSPSAEWATSLLAFALIMLVSFVNCISAKITEKMQNWLMVVNILTISLIVSCGFAYMLQFGVTNHSDFKVDLPHPPPQITSSSEVVKFQILQLVKAAYQASFSYSGSTYLNFITEELEDPIKNLPRGILISLPMIIFLNVLVNFCYLATLSTEAIESTQTIGSDMFRAVVPANSEPYISWLVPTLIATAVTGGLSSNILTCSRVAFTGARNGHFPRMFSLLHYKENTPIISIIFLGILACVFVLVGNIPTLILIATYLDSAANCICIYGLIHLRIKKPFLYRPFKLPLILPIFYAVVATFIFIVPIVTLDKNSAPTTLPVIGGAIFVLVTGVPSYFLFIKKNRQWSRLENIHDTVMVFLQKLFMMIHEPILILEQLDLDETEIQETAASLL